MRALIVTNLYPTPAWPSSGAFVARQVESLRAAGVDVDVLHLDRELHGRRVYRGLRARVRELALAVEPDLVHVMYGGVMADVVTREVRDAPVVVSFCGTDLLGGGASSLLGYASRRVNVLASRRAAKRAAGVVVKSRNLRDALPAGLDPSRVWIVPNGVDLARFSPRDKAACQKALGLDLERRHVLFPSSPDRPEKRFALALAAVDRVRLRRDDLDLHVLSDVLHEDVPLWLNAADVVLLTSRHEGSPNVVKEALACNVPVVAVDVGDIRERLAGIDGCIVSDNTPSALAGALEDVMSRNSPIEARRQVLELGLDNIAAKLVEIYDSLHHSVSGGVDEFSNRRSQDGLRPR